VAAAVTADVGVIGARYQTCSRNTALLADNGLTKLAYKRLRNPCAPTDFSIGQLTQIWVI
jgi:hypothetical protein